MPLKKMLTLSRKAKGIRSGRGSLLREISYLFRHMMSIEYFLRPENYIIGKPLKSSMDY